jgi:NTE family protein
VLAFLENTDHRKGLALDGARKKRVAIACQGGGSHTAFTAGALKRLLQEEDRYEFVALSGTSGGAVCALLAWYALIEHGRNGASEAASEAARSLEKFWLEDNAARDVPERLLNDWLVGGLRWQQATGILIETSPNAFSDYWQNRLRLILEDNVPFGKLDEELVRPASPKLFVGAVEVLTGEFKVFGSHKREDADGSSWVYNDDPEGGIGVGAILASAAIPPVFRSVQVGEGVYWDGLFSQNPPIRELLEARPDEVWVIQINPNRMSPRPRDPAPGDEPTSVVDIIDRRNALSGNLSLNQELRYVEKINEMVEDLGNEGPEGKRLRVRRGKVYKPVVVRKIEMSRPLGAASKLDRSPPFIQEMMRYGEQRAEEFFGALAFEEAWVSGDPEAVLSFFAENAEVRIEGTAPFSELRASYEGEEQIGDFVRERLAGDVRIDPTRKQVAGEAVIWTVRISSRLSGEADGEPAEGTAEAMFESGKIRTLTFTSGT